MTKREELIDFLIYYQPDNEVAEDIVDDYLAKHSPVEQKKSCDSCDDFPNNPFENPCINCHQYDHWKSQPK